MFEKIYERAISAAKNNEQIIEQYKTKKNEYEKNTSKEERVRDESLKSKWFITNTPNKDDVLSEELFDLIKKFGFKITEYAKRIDDIDYYEEYDPVIEYYSVNNDKYKFIIKNLSDVDITEGIFAVYEIERLTTNEKISFYLDLGCRNTTENKLDDFLLLISCDSTDEYLNKKFSKYFALPKLLTEKGYVIIENNLEYSINSIKGFIKVLDNVYVIPYYAWKDEVRVVVTNSPKWDVNDSNSYNKIGYYVDYKSVKDIDILVENIEALNKHVLGKYGYLENGIYYKNKDVDIFFDSFSKKDSNGNYLKSYNHHIIEIDKIKEWDGRGYGDYSYINVYRGLEIASHYIFTINNDGCYIDGIILNTSDIVIKYDKNVDKDKCILSINNYQYKSSDYFYTDYDSNEYIDKLSTRYNKKYLVDFVEYLGTFTECMDILKEYILTLLEIFDVDIVTRE